MTAVYSKNYTHGSCAFLCCAAVVLQLILPMSVRVDALLLRGWGVHMVYPTPLKQPWRINWWLNAKDIICLLNPHAQAGWGVYWNHLVRLSIWLSVRPSVCRSIWKRHGFQSKTQVCSGISISNFIWVRSRNCGCLFTWFCYQLITKPGNKTATVPWPDPYACCLCLWAEAYLFPVMSLSKWPPGSHIGFFGFRTLTIFWLWISSPNFTGSSLRVYRKKPIDFQQCHF